MAWQPTVAQVEKVARTGYDFDQTVAVEFGQVEPLDFDSLPEWAQETHREKARAVLAAVGPMISRQAWDEGYTATGGRAWHEREATNPYREERA